MGKIFAVSGGQQMGKTILCHELVRELNLRNQSVGFVQEAVLRSKYMFKESRCIEMHLETIMFHILGRMALN